MIRLSRPEETEALDNRPLSYLKKRSAIACAFAPHDPCIDTAWSSFLRTKSRKTVAEALDRYTRGKCAYCEQIAAKDIEHFWPKTSYPARMFAWDNLLRGCKNCNKAKRDRFPIDNRGKNLLLDPCEDEPLDHFVWDSLTGAWAVVPDPSQAERGRATIDLFELNQEPLREERRNKLLDVLYLLSHVIQENSITQETRDRLHDHLQAHRPWLGPIRQLFLRSEEPVRSLVNQAQAKLPEIRDWIEPWI